MTQPGLFPFIAPALPPLYAVPHISEDDMAEADYEALCAALDSLRGALATLTAMQSLAHAPAVASALAVSAEHLRGEIARLSLARVEIVS